MSNYDGWIETLCERIAALETRVKVLEEACLPQESDDPAFHTPVREANEPPK